MKVEELFSLAETYEHFFRDPFSPRGWIGEGSKGIACQNVQKALSEIGYPVAPTGAYNAETKAAIMKLQTKYADLMKRSPDGIVGSTTRALLVRDLLESPNGASWFSARGTVSAVFAVFVSYCRDDREQVAPLVSGMKAARIPVFLDVEGIPKGANWPAALLMYIRACDVFLCMLSETAAASANVLVEVAMARHAKRLIVPAMLEKIELDDPLNLLLNFTQRVDLYQLPVRSNSTNPPLAAAKASTAFGTAQPILKRGMHRPAQFLAA